MHCKIIIQKAISRNLRSFAVTDDKRFYDVFIFPPFKLFLKLFLQVARMQRRSMPPRCNPFAILLIVISVGMMFIGITMTIISHWPGATQIGEDPLKIAGPVLFGVGALLVIFSVFLIYFLNQRERRRWDENLAKLVTTKL